ncbi:MAG: serine/threonine protein kinase [Anaerolineaceae bacterium]|nr:serine/threonine protein kinase [Anaerolineaceae bacterium]
MIGSVLGNRYRILREIGAGGMAKVYLAEDISGNELVAVKVLYPQFSQDISFIQRFNREAKLASTLTDSHIVRVLDYGADRDLQYLVMEYVEGKDLNSALKENGPFEWRYALEILDQLATALEHAHVHGVVHRDIKPQNLMLNDNGLLKILDFGIARIPTLPSLTQSGFIGSPYYASPEQAMGEEVDIRSDIYSAGIVLYEILSGRIPFDAKSPWSIISQHITSEPPPIELPDREIPQNVQDLLKRMLAKRPDERFQSPTELRQGIATVFAGQSVPEDTQDLSLDSSTEKTPLIESLNQRANEAIKAQEWVRAVDLLRQAAKLDPDNRNVANKLAEVETEAQVASLYKSGVRAIDNKRWEEAINHFNVLSELRGGYRDTETLLAKAHQALKLENRQKFVDARYKEGLAHFENERWTSAAAAFAEVRQLSPDYEQVERLFNEAQKLSNPSLALKLKQMGGQLNLESTWRWGLVVAGIIAVTFLFFLAFGNNNQVSGNDDPKEHLKTLYEEVRQALEDGNKELALTYLDEILADDPDYADAADIKRELLATPTPSVAANSTAQNEQLDQLINEAQSNIDLEVWDDAINTLKLVRAKDEAYQKALVSSLLCDAYSGRGLNSLARIDAEVTEKSLVNQALSDFEAGVAACPRRTDLADQMVRARAYLEVLDTPKSEYEALIATLNPIVAANPNYANGNAKQILYNAYLNRGTERQQTPELKAAALGDYEAALTLNVDDPSEAQTKRAELLLSFSQQQAGIPTIEPVETEESSPESPVVATPTREAPSASPGVAIKYNAPVLQGPPDDSIFAGTFAEVFLEWQGPAQLAPGEYYDVTIMHLFAEEPQYSGSQRTNDTRVQLTADIGVGQAGNDRFYWWVTIRKENTAPYPGALDLPVSPRSEAKTFVWSP